MPSDQFRVGIAWVLEYQGNDEIDTLARKGSYKLCISLEAAFEITKTYARTTRSYNYSKMLC